VIAAENLRFRYSADAEELFGGLDHQFPERCLSVITGASGRGKSTLLYLIGLLITPTEGRIHFGDSDVGDLSDGSRSTLRASSIGFVFQDAALDTTRSVLDNVVEGALYAGMRRRTAENRARRLLDHFGVELRSDHRPGEVSGGQAQRVGLCRALIKNPRIILADEPTGNLDEASATVVLDALRDAADSGAIVIVASHDPVVAARGDVIIDL
jgi:putative ABC transport system ATP-binding protein/lipoprotein-releasing system ATP-binding protein